MGQLNCVTDQYGQYLALALKNQAFPAGTFYLGLSSVMPGGGLVGYGSGAHSEDYFSSIAGVSEVSAPGYAQVAVTPGTDFTISAGSGPSYGRVITFASKQFAVTGSSGINFAVRCLLLWRGDLSDGNGTQTHLFGSMAMADATYLTTLHAAVGVAGTTIVVPDTIAAHMMTNDYWELWTPPTGVELPSTAASDWELVKVVNVGAPGSSSTGYTSVTVAGNSAANYAGGCVYAHTTATQCGLFTRTRALAGVVDTYTLTLNLPAGNY